MQDKLIKWSGKRRFSLDPRDRRFFDNPYSAYQQIHQRSGPVFWQEYGMWCLASFEAVDHCLRDKRFARLPPKGFERKPYAPHLQDFAQTEKLSLLALEPPEHTRLRRLVNRAFVSRQVEEMEQEITLLSNECIDKFESDHKAELLTQYATPIPVTVIARLLGIPESACGQLLEWSHAMVKVYTMTQSYQDEVNANQAAMDFMIFLKEQISTRRKSPDGRLLSHLISLQSEVDGPSDEEIVSIVILLLNAGHEATVHQLGNAIKTLVSNAPDQQDWWKNRKVADQIVAECMRHDAPLHLFTRFAQERVELCDDVTIEAGTEIALLLGAANHCPIKFNTPEKLDINRSEIGNVSLGAGIHFCIGAALAKLELRVALCTLFERLPTMELVEEPRYRDSFHFHGLESLKVVW